MRTIVWQDSDVMGELHVHACMLRLLHVYMYLYHDEAILQRKTT